MNRAYAILYDKEISKHNLGMDTIQLLKSLKDAVEKLSSELDQSIAREKNLEDALNQSFPYSLYKQLRPAVVEALGERVLGRIAAKDIYAPNSDEVVLPSGTFLDENNVEVVRQLLTSDPDIVHQLTSRGLTDLGKAASKGYDEMVELLLSFKADIEAKTKMGNTPLMLAVYNNHVSTCRILLQRGANSNTVSNDGWTPLLLASERGYYEICELLICHKADVNKVHTETGHTPLSLASLRGHSKIVTLLLQHGANVHSRDKQQFTPLILASQEGHLDIVKTLIQHGAKWNDRQITGAAAIHMAAQNNRHEVVRYLVATAGCPVDLVSCHNIIPM